MLVSYPLAFLVIRTIKETNYEDEHVVFVGDEKRADDEASNNDEKVSEPADSPPLAAA